MKISDKCSLGEPLSKR
jgi:hypothetical protein